MTIPKPPASPRDESAEERYLWDPTAPPEPGVQELEARLGELRPPAAFDPSALPPRLAPRRPWPWRPVVGALAAAAAVLWLLRSRPAPPITAAPDLPASAQVAEGLPALAWRATTGQPIIGGAARGAAGQLVAGSWLETDQSTEVRLQVADIGHLDIAPGSRLRLLESGPGGHRLDLARGRVSAVVDAPPRLFVIRTKSATAIDLGCAYELSASEAGDGMLRVTSGAVELEGGQSRVLPVRVPQGAECPIHAGRGPGTPVWSRLSAQTKADLAAADADPADLGALERALAALHDRDSLTWLHLLETVPEARRGSILDRLVSIVPLPAGVTREALLARERGALEAYRAVIAPRWVPGPAGKGVWAPDPGEPKGTEAPAP